MEDYKLLHELDIEFYEFNNRVSRQMDLCDVAIRWPFKLIKKGIKLDACILNQIISDFLSLC